MSDAVMIDTPVSAPYVHPAEELALRDFTETLDRRSVLRHALEEVLEALRVGDQATVLRRDPWWDEDDD